jgi:hypothetical protein
VNLLWLWAPHRQSLTQWDASRQSHDESVGSYAVFPSPVRSRSSVVNTCLASVAPLLFRGSPAAIARLVVAIVIDAIKGMIVRWTGAHVGVEVLKRQPTLADLNASTSVSLVPLGFRVVASLPHGGPSHPFFAGPHPMPWPESPVLREIGRSTAAALAKPVAQHVAPDLSRGPARTTAHESWLAALAIAGAMKNGPSTEGLPGKVLESHALILPAGT